MTNPPDGIQPQDPLARFRLKIAENTTRGWGLCETNGPNRLP